jgi:hypothetical protein
LRASPTVGEAHGLRVHRALRAFSVLRILLYCGGTSAVVTAVLHDPTKLRKVELRCENVPGAALLRPAAGTALGGRHRVSLRDAPHRILPPTLDTRPTMPVHAKADHSPDGPYCSRPTAHQPGTIWPKRPHGVVRLSPTCHTKTVRNFAFGHSACPTFVPAEFTSAEFTTLPPHGSLPAHRIPPAPPARRAALWVAAAQNGTDGGPPQPRRAEQHVRTDAGAYHPPHTLVPLHRGFDGLSERSPRFPDTRPFGFREGAVCFG